MAKRFHVNPGSGEVGECRAKVKCEFDTPDYEHYDTKEEARAGAETKLEAEFMDTGDVSSHVKNVLQNFDNDGVHSYHIEAQLQEIDSGMVWTQKSRENLLALKQMSDLMQHFDMNSPDNLAESERIMERFKLTNPGLFPTDDYREATFDIGRDRSIAILMENSYLKTKWEHEANSRVYQTMPYQVNKKLSGEDSLAAQMENLQRFNAAHCEPNERNIGFSAEKHFHFTKDRLIGNEIVNPNYANYPQDIVPKHDKLMAALENENQLYLSTVFVDKELKKAMETKNIKDGSVGVASFYNTREWGNVYTVTQPDGNKRSFSVYEHRNSDDIIINGKTNWEGDHELPYSGDSKYKYFGSFDYNRPDQAAESLARWIEAAQDGRLDSDEEILQYDKYFD